MKFFQLHYSLFLNLWSQHNRMSMFQRKNQKNPMIQIYYDDTRVLLRFIR